MGTNLSGSNFKNSYKTNNDLRNTYIILSGSEAEGFDRLHQKTVSNSNEDSDYIHLFTDLFHVEQPPFL